MNKKNIISASNSTILKLNALVKEKESVRTKLAVVAKKLAATAKIKENVRKQLVVTAKEKENIRKKLVVTAEKLAVIAKEKEEEQIIFDSVPALVFYKNTENRFIRVNKAFADVMKMPKEKLEGKSCFDLYPKKQADAFLKDDLEIIASGKPKRNIVESMKSPDGTLWVKTDKIPYKDKTGKIIGIIGFTLDITKEKEAEEKVRVQTQELENANKASRNMLEDLNIEKLKADTDRAKDEAILASIGDGIIAVNSGRRIIIINRMAEKLFGRKADEVIGKFYEDVISLEDEKGNSVAFKERPLTKTLSSFTTTTTTNLYLVSKNKVKFPVAITMSPVVLDKKIIGAVEVFRDITKEQEIDKAKTEFVSLASHQLRTPLTTISWYTEMILKGDVGKVVPSQKKYLEKIYAGNHRMIELVNTLLDASRIEMGTFMIRLELINIVELTQSVADELNLEINQKKITFTSVFGTDIPLMQTDPKLLHMVVQNILSNAIEYTPEKGKIELSLALDNKNKTVLLKIVDTGYGIPKNQQDKIFTKLFRADNVREKDTDGTGLGLAIVKSIVENLGGKVWFESEENRGTTFYVSLPLSGMKEKKGTKSLI